MREQLIAQREELQEELRQVNQALRALAVSSRTGLTGALRCLFLADTERWWSVRELCVALPRYTQLQVSAQVNTFVQRAQVERAGRVRPLKYRSLPKMQEYYGLPNRAARPTLA